MPFKPFVHDCVIMYQATDTEITLEVSMEMETSSSGNHIKIHWQKYNQIIQTHSHGTKIASFISQPLRWRSERRYTISVFGIKMDQLSTYSPI